MHLFQSSLLIAALSAPGLAAAQSAPAPSDATVEQEIVVIGTRASLSGALDVKREADGFVDAIVAAEIAQFPDLNLAEALQRVPGVTITRTQGEGSQLIVRGFTPDFTRVEINGMSATPTSLGREFNFSIFASELFNRAEVRKTGSADQTEGGLAGTVQLFTPKPFDLKDGLTFAASAQGSYAELSESTDPRAAIVVGHNWDDKFGVVGTLAYSDQAFVSQWVDVSNWDRLTDSLTAGARAGLSADVLDAWVPRAPRVMHFDRSRERLGASLDVQYQPSEDLKLTWSTLYGDTDRAGLELRTDLAELEGGLTFASNVQLDNISDGRGRIIGGEFGQANARAYTTQTSDAEEFLQSVLRAEFNLPAGWRGAAQVGQTEGTGVFFDRAYSFGVLGTGTVTTQGSFVNVTLPGVSTTDPADFVDFRFADYRFRTKQDDEFAAQIDISRDIDFGPFSAVGFGARYADHTASVREDKWGGINNANPVFPATARDANGRALGLNGVPAGGVTLVPFGVDGQPAGIPTQIMQFNFEVLDAFYGVGALSTTYRPLDSYEVGEEISALYAKLDVDTDIAGVPVTGNLGTRWVDTAITSSGARRINNVDTPIQVERSYAEWLPSGTLRADLTEALVLRAAAGRTLNRPRLADLSPRATLDVGRNVGSSGNPELDPFTATYFDLGLEWYFGREALVGVTYFRKDIDSLVETLAEDVTLVVPGTLGGPAVPTQFQLTRPINGEDATVQGIEFLVQTPFTFLPAPLDNLGGLFNYTYNESEASFQNAADVSAIQLPGLSKNSFNAVLYWQSSRLDVRLAYAWRDDFVDIPFGPGGNPIWQDAFGQLDLSATFNVTDRLALKMEALNLTQEAEFLYTAGREDLAVRNAENERRFAIGFRYTY